MAAQKSAGSQKNREAFEALVRRHMSFVYAIAYRYVQSTSDAEDVSQDVFVKVWSNLKRFDSAKSFKGWVAEITKNTCLDLQKKRRTIPFAAFTKEDGSNVLYDTLVDPSELPIALADQSIFRRVLSATVQKLSPAYQKVISLYYDSGLNFREIAIELDEPLHTVKSRHHRAISRLRELLS